MTLLTRRSRANDAFHPVQVQARVHGAQTGVALLEDGRLQRLGDQFQQDARGFVGALTEVLGDLAGSLLG